jgi:hypothetical protein
MRARLAFVMILAFFAGCSNSNGPQLATVAPDAFEKPNPAPKEDKPDAAPEDERESEVVVKNVKGKLTLPPDGGEWPIVAAPKVKPQPVTLTHLLNDSLHPTSAAVSLTAGRAVILLWEVDFKRKKNGTHLFWCDLEKGKVTHTWDASQQFMVLFDIHADGRQFLLRRHDGSERDRHVLHLWSVAEDGRLLRKEWEPYYAGQSNDGEPRENDAHHIHRPEADVRWAAFAGPNHIVTVAGSGEMKVWERESLKQVAILTGVVGLPTLTNDGERVVFATNDRVAVFDPKAMRLSAALHVNKPPENAALALRADGKRLAIVGTGRAIVVNMETGTSWDQMLPELRMENHQLLPDFGWASESDIYYHGDLYDLQVPIKIWHYGVPHWSAARGGKVWAITNALGEKETVLRAFTLPHERAERAIQDASQRSDLFVLKPGDKVRVDVSGLPTNKQKEVREILERRVRELGYRLDEIAATVFVASVDKTGSPVSKTYTIGKSQVTGTYNERCARLKIVQNGRKLWEEAGTESPGMLIFVPTNTDPKEYISRFGSPDYEMYSKRPLPGLLRAHKAEPLGHSQLTSKGITEWR